MKTLMVYLLLIGFLIQSTWSQNSNWTLKNDTEFYYSGVSSRKQNKLPFKKLRKNTRVNGIATYTAKFCQVCLENGEIGYVNLIDIKEAEKIRIYDSIYLKETENRKSRGKYHNAESAIILKEAELSTVYLKLDNGYKGYAPFNAIHPIAFDSLPEINQTAKRILHHEVLRESTYNIELSEVIETLGPPSGLWFDNEKEQNGYIFYSYYIIVKDKKRSSRLWLPFEKGVVKGDSIINGEKYFSERLPLAQTFRKNLNLASLTEPPLYEPNNEVSWWDEFQDMNWLTWLLGKFVWLLTIALVFSLPAIVLYPLLILIARIRRLNNTMVIGLYVILIFGCFYFYMLWLELQVFYQSSWLALILCSVFWFMATKSYWSLIEYNRCPACHALYSASDHGTSLVGRIRSKQKVARDVFSHQTSRNSISGNTKYVENHYNRHWDDKITTTEKYKDHRHCVECGYNWDVKRETTTTKTIKH